MLITIFRRAVVYQSLVEVYLAHVVPLGAVIHGYIYIERKIERERERDHVQKENTVERITNQLHSLCNPEVQCRIHKVSNNPYPEPNQPNVSY